MPGPDAVEKQAGIARNESTLENLEATLLLRGERVVACNKHALSLFESDREALLGASFLDLSVATQPNGRASAESLRIRIAAALAEQRQSFEWNNFFVAYTGREIQYYA